MGLSGYTEQITCWLLLGFTDNAECQNLSELGVGELIPTAFVYFLMTANILSRFHCLQA